MVCEKSEQKKSIKHFSTKKEAEPFAIQIAKKDRAELFYHKQDGKFQDRNSYGNDPHPPKK